MLFKQVDKSLLWPPKVWFNPKTFKRESATKGSRQLRIINRFKRVGARDATTSKQLVRGSKILVGDPLGPHLFTPKLSGATAFFVSLFLED